MFSPGDIDEAIIGLIDLGTPEGTDSTTDGGLFELVASLRQGITEGFDSCGLEWAPNGKTDAMTRTVDIVPHTHWDREWYPPFQTFRLRLVDLLDELLPAARGRPVLRPLPARRADGGGRRLPRRAARGRGRGCGALATSRPAGDGALVRPARRVPRVGRDARAQPAARPRAWRPRFGGAMEVGLPARHVRPRRPDAPAPRASSASSTPSCGGACPSAIDRSGFWWSAPDGSTVRAEYLPAGLRQRRPRARRRQGARRAASTSSSEEQGDLLARPDPLDERHRPPDARSRGSGRVVAEANALEDGYELRDLLAGRAPAAARRPTGLPELDGRAALGRPRQPAHGRGVEPGRREAGGGPRPSAPLERLAEPLSALFLPAERWPGALLDEAWLEVHPQQRPRLDLRLLGRRGRATPCSTASPRPRRSPTGLADRALAGPRRQSPSTGAGAGGRQPVGPRPRRAGRAARCPGDDAARRARQLVSERAAPSGC